MISVMNNDCEFERKPDAKVEDIDVSGQDDIDVASREERIVNSGGENEGKVSSVELDSVVPKCERSEEVRVRVSSESGKDSVKKETESRVNEAKKEKMSGNQIDKPFGAQSNELEVSNDRNVNNSASRVDRPGEGYKSLLSEFDDYVANEKINAGVLRALRYGFEVGDMVWGKVKSHPWWPGHIFNEAFATSSVRHTRRDGYVLVAFFGDSSYGWFDPAELIPFEPHFAEKSQQTYSRTFIRAVEEAIDEASRRNCIGLACKCRNPYNFRPTEVEGYFAVDVPEYEPGGIYSMNQITKARDRFNPSETLSFVKQLATAPTDCEQRSIDFIKNKATVSAFRKAAFEEFDETYAQAFGVQPSRANRERISKSEQSVKQTSRAPLSGPMVFQETLGGGKSSKKTTKTKDQSKKDRYLFKRRDERSESKTLQVSQGESGSSASLALMEGSSASTAGEDFVLQKRSPSLHGLLKSEQTNLTGDISGKDGDSVAAKDEKIPADVHETKEKMASSEVLGSARKSESDVVMDGVSAPPQQEAFVDKNEESVKTPMHAKHIVGVSADGSKVKMPMGSLSSEGSEKKKKKKRKAMDSEMISDQKNKRLAPGKGEVAKGNTPKKSSQESGQVAMIKQVNMGNIGVELPHLLKDLHGLALDPFHGAERNSPAIVRRFFLRFRSSVFQKSLVLSQPSDSEPIESRPLKSSSSINTSNENVREFPAPKPMKQIPRTNDHTKAGRKRLPSERQEENVAKRLKKISHLKSLTAEKKTGQKALDSQRVEGKEHAGAVPPSKVAKLNLSRRSVPPARAIEPTMLVMKFPPGTSLPSAAELKARFGRFGSIDQSATRVFWKSLTCRVVFRHKADAQAACKYANSNSSLFGNVKVKYFIREVEVPAPEAPEPDRAAPRVDVHPPSNDLSRIKDPIIDRPMQAAPPPLQPPVQLKSCLKKPTGEEAGQATGGNGRGTARVKFMLGGDETPRTTATTNASRGEPLTMIGNKNNNATTITTTTTTTTTYGDVGGANSSTTASSVGMDFNSKNFQKGITTSTTSPMMPPQQFTKPQYNNIHHNLNAPLPTFRSSSSSSSVAPSIDISQQMLTLLTRCNEVVNNVKGMLGYVPYHPL